jgi:hypothetical protein
VVPASLGILKKLRNDSTKKQFRILYTNIEVLFSARKCFLAALEYLYS